MTKLRYSMFVVTVLLALALSAMITVPALADDTAPPPTETPTVETPPTEVVTEAAPPVEEAAPAEVPIVEEAAPEEIAPVEETAPQDETVTDLLASVPEGTEVVVVNEAGETVPLVTQEAADAIVFVDPVWCPAGVAPKTDGTGGCTTSFASLKLLVDALMNGTAGVTPGTNGTIWIAAGADASAGAILLDGTDASLGTMETFSLTLQGGWNGVHNSTTASLLTPSTFTQSLSITNWQGMITLNNITFSGVTTGSASNNAALNVHTTKNVILNNVNTNSNTGANVKGVYIDNDEVVNIVVSSVTVNTSNINGNNGAGLTVFSDGIITLKDVTASNNNGATADGIFLNNTAGTAVGIIFSGATIAADNGGDGIEAYSDGAITASNLVANSNGGFGTILDNATAATALGVTISGSSNQFKFNGLSGLDIASNGAITLNSISATNNSGGQGAFLDNDGFLNGLANVTLTGTNNFKENFNDGLVIYSDGMVTLSNIAANDNGLGASNGYGLFVDNDGASTPKAVTLTGFNEFYNNYSGGLGVFSDGAITISNLTASFNQNGRGADLTNAGAPSPQNVTLTGTTNVNGNGGGNGLTINTQGVISIGSITANDNNGHGVSINNNSGTAPKAVTLSGASNNFNGNTANGLIIFSLGAVTLNNVTATFNTNGCGICVNNNFALAVGGITLNGISYVDSNGRDGINFESKGNILLKDLDSTNNGVLQSAGQIDGYGAYLDNTAGTGTVIIGTSKANWFNGFSGNFLSGLEIYSNGTVTLSNITADGNGLDNGPDPVYGYGLYVDNRGATTPKVVTLNGINQFNNNFSGGVVLLSDGAITASKVTANDNFGGGGSGAFFSNITASPLVPQNVTLNGYGDFFGNGGRGLEVQSYGVVTLNSIYADTNGSDGIFVDNYSGATMVRAVTINGYANTYNNGGFGLYILSRGAIKVNNLDAWNNDAGGATLDNHEAGAVGGVTVTGHTWAGGSSAGDGLQVESYGAINITNLSTWNNAGDGATLDNAWVGSVFPVTILGYASAGFNGGSGLNVYSNRVITITNLHADTNGGDGAYIDNSYSGTALPQNVTVNGYGEFYNNGDTGLWIYTYGIITTNNLTANDNGQNGDNTPPVTGWGVILDNSDADPSKPKGVTLNGTNTFNGNFQDGLYVASLGAIKANNLTAIANDGNGAYLDNQFDLGFFGVTLTGTNIFDSNGGAGLVIYSNGAVSLNNLSGSWNTGGEGVFIDTTNQISQAKVTITGNNYLNGNSSAGLVILADAAVSLNNIMANWNGADGAFINNFDAQGGSWDNATLKITGVNNFSGNAFSGLIFRSTSNVDISKITADNNDPTNLNGGIGVNGYSNDAGITITCGSMTNNGTFGWQFDALTTITLKGVFATGNGNPANTNVVFGTLITTRTCPLP